MAVLWAKRQLGKPYRDRESKSKMSNSNSDDFVYVECEFKTKTKGERGAVLISQGGSEIWVPRSCLSWSSDKAIDTLERGDKWDMKVREWFATKNDLEYTT